MTPALQLEETQSLRDKRRDFLFEIAKGKPLDEHARLVFEWILDLDPQNASAINSLGRIAINREDWPEALRYFKDAADLVTDDARPCINYATVSDKLRDFESVRIWLAEAKRRDPANPWIYVGLLALASLEGDDAAEEAAINEGLQQEHPELLFARSCMHLKRGNWEQGWKDYEWRPSRLVFVDTLDEIPEWKGESLIGKTLLVCGEQGFGDQVLFSRYLDYLPHGSIAASMRAKVYVSVRSDLIRLMASYGHEMLTTDEQVNSIPIDYWIGISSLPLVLGMFEPITIPAYKHPPRVPRLTVPRTGNLRVGLCWRGHGGYSRDGIRSMRWEDMKPLLDVPGCDFYSLQKVDNESSLPALLDRCHDFLDDASVIAEMDLVITADTAIGHIAGAMGKPCWVLLAQPCDWRWGAKGETTVWYPNHFLWRQETLFDWSDVIRRVHQQLSVVWGPSQKPVHYGNADNPQHKGDDQAHQDIADDGSNAGGHAQIVTLACRYGPMNIYQNDVYIGRALELYGEYSESEASLLRDVLKPGDTVVEAGANIGALTVPIAQIVGKSGKVLAFEPQATYCNLLTSNTPGNVTVHHKGLGSEVGLLSTRAANETMRQHSPGWPGRGEYITIEQVTVDSLNLDALNLLKIDVDGQEQEILVGAEQTIARFRPIIYVEHDKTEMYPNLIPWLLFHDYKVYKHNGPLFNPKNFNAYPLNVFGSIVSMMLLCIPKGQYLDESVIKKHGLNRVRLKTAAS